MSTKTTASQAAADQDTQHLVVEGHGNSPAAWTLVAVSLFGILVGCIGFCIPSAAVMIVGAVITVVGFVLGYVLKAAGFGVGGHRVKQNQH